MARRNPEEELVRIAEVVAKSGYPAETVWNTLRPGEGVEFETWDHEPAIRASRATEVLDELLAAREENNRWNRQNIDAQIELEKDGRLAPYRAWQREVASSKNRVPGGVQAFGPDDPTPRWGEGEDTDLRTLPVSSTQ